VTGGGVWRGCGLVEFDCGNPLVALPVIEASLPPLVVLFCAVTTDAHATRASKVTAPKRDSLFTVNLLLNSLIKTQGQLQS
jgi:hypothetical protein